MKPWKYFAAAAMPVLILLSLPLRPACIVHFGTTVTLAVRPVDPRDLFRGDYVALSFEAETLPLELFDVPRGMSAHALASSKKWWYVALAPDALGLWRPRKVFSRRPEGVALKGTVKYVTSCDEGMEAVLDYGSGMKRFYVKENGGRAFEAAARQSALLADVKVWRGEAVIQSLRVVGAPTKRP